MGKTGLQKLVESAEHNASDTIDSQQIVVVILIMLITSIIVVVVVIIRNKVFPDTTYRVFLFGEMSTCEKDPLSSYILFILFSF